jgi:hypothetical protein
MRHQLLTGFLLCTADSIGCINKQCSIQITGIAYLFLQSFVIISSFNLKISRAGIAQSVERLGYRLDDEDKGFISRQGQQILLYSMMSRPIPGPTRPPIQGVLEAVPMWVKRQGREADHSPLCSAEV